MSECNPGKVCTHDGPCNKDCGGDHYYYEDGVCLRCGAKEQGMSRPKPKFKVGQTVEMDGEREYGEIDRLHFDPSDGWEYHIWGEDLHMFHFEENLRAALAQPTSRRAVFSNKPQDGQHDS